jgi:hypothetical protein
MATGSSRQQAASKFRYPLRSLIALQVVVCLFLLWWRIPFTTTAHIGFGRYRQSVVRRGWDLQLYRHGVETVYYDNGQKCCEHEAYGIPYYPYTVSDSVMPGVRCWDREGREIAAEELMRQ